MTRDEKGRFVKGNTEGNGRPKGIAGLAEQIKLATNDGSTLVKFYMSVFQGGERARLEHRMEAAKWLAERGWGKAVQQIEANINPVAKVYEGLDIDRV